MFCFVNYLVSCAKLTCPDATFSCHVSSEAIADNRKMMKTTAECLNSTGAVLQKTEFEEPNPYPEEEPPYSIVAEVDREGEIKITSSNGLQSFVSKKAKKLTKEEQEKLDKDIAEHMRRINDQIRRQQEEMDRHFSQIFGPGFPFGNSYPVRNDYNSYSPFGSNFPFNNGFGFNNNWPFNSYNSFGFYPSNSYNPHPPQPQLPVTNTFNRYPSSNSFNPHLPNPDDRFNPAPQPFEPDYAPNFNTQRPQKEIEIQTNTDHYNEDNEIYEETTPDRALDNKIINYHDKYRYAHDNLY